MMVEPCFKILEASVVILLWETARGSKQCPYVPLPHQIPLDLLDHMTLVAEKPAQQPGPVAESSLVLGPTQNSELSKSLSKRTRVKHVSEECVASKLQIGPLGTVPLFCL